MSVRSTSRSGDGLALAGLLLARTGVSYQFQSITVLELPVAGGRRLGIDQVGLLLSLYLSAGLILAIASPAIGARYGIRRAILVALGLMAAGQALVALPLPFEALALARAVAGLGGALIYVVAFGAAAELTAPASMAVRMGLVAATWPLGNALALLFAPALANASGPEAALWSPVGLFGLALVAMSASGVGFPARGRASATLAADARAWLSALRGVWPVGVAFASYNAAFILFTSFAASLFVDQGVAVAEAAWLASLPMWAFLLSVPGGGWMAARLPGYERALVTSGCLLSAACLALAVAGKSPGWVLVGGLIGGLPTAPLLAMATRQQNATANETFGALFAIFFVTISIASPLVGELSQVGGPLMLSTVISLLLAAAAFMTVRSRVPS